MNAWRVQDQRAFFESKPWRIEFNPHRPQDGLTVENESGSLHRGVLAIDFPGAQSPEPVQDSYPRGVDLVVAYEQHSERTVLPHVYIRVAEASINMLAVQLIVSMQTSLLSSTPSTSIRSPRSNGEFLWRSSDGCWSTTQDSQALATLQRFPENGSFFQAIHESDFESSTPEDNESVGYRVFSESLEKGVIRRARVLVGITTSHDGDTELAERCFQQQATEAPPLTT